MNKAIAFENIPELCFTYGKMGHLSENCSVKKVDVDKGPTKEMQSEHQNRH
ncbi:hypothetical protein Cni_G29231 [Canna indica]|uniref:CCHC-type domain-containing protein n=1 Tax=Canna indica TaxID=4628 RepID=A0AAQ3L8R5_9LILI|nr:hypothetical protein Cni_G29231 [Canna indica]